MHRTHGNQGNRADTGERMTVRRGPGGEPPADDSDAYRKAGVFFDHLRRKVSRQQFATWFQRTKVVSWTSGKLEVGVPNRFYQEWM